MQFKSLRLRNFQSHDDTRVDKLGPVTVLVGPNGAGKSALFDGIRTLCRLLSGPVAQAFGPAPFSFESRLHRGAPKPEMGFEASFFDEGFDVDYSISIGFTGNEREGDPPTVLSESVNVGGTLVFDRAKKVVALPGIRADPLPSDQSLLAMVRHVPDFKHKALSPLARHVGSCVRYRLEPRQLSLPSQEPDLDPDARGTPRLGYEGDNLASLLFWLRERQPEILAKIVRDLGRVIPKLRAIQFNFVGADRVGFSLQFDDARQAIPAPNTSSGTLLLLGLVTLLNAPSQPDIACIEEPETGLTPDAVRLFFELLCQTAEPARGRRSSQFLFSSHSPFVLVDAWNKLSPDRSFIKRLRIDDGRSVVENMQEIIAKGDSGAVLTKDKNGSLLMGLKTAEELMCGRFLPR